MDLTDAELIEILAKALSGQPATLSAATWAAAVSAGDEEMSSEFWNLAWDHIEELETVVGGGGETIASGLHASKGILDLSPYGVWLIGISNAQVVEVEILDWCDTRDAALAALSSIGWSPNSW